MVLFKLLLTICGVTLFWSPQYAANALMEKTKTLALTLSSLELRKNQRDELEKTLVTLKKRAEENKKTINQTLAKVSLDLSETQKKLESAHEDAVEFLNKKISILNDRKQILIDSIERLKENTELLEQHIKLINEFITFLETPRNELKPAYTWKEFRDAQTRLNEYSSKIEIEVARRNNLKKQRTAANERLASLEKQRENKNKEREKFIVQNEKKVVSDDFGIKYEAEILTQELNALAEKISYINLLIGRFDIEPKLWDDIIELEQQKLNEQKIQLTHIEHRLILDYSDVDAAKNEWKAELTNSLKTKDAINAEKEPKKASRDKLTAEIDLLQQRITELKAKGVKEHASYLLVKAQQRKSSALLQSLDRELALLDAKKELADILALEKEVQFNTIELRYKLKIEHENLESLINNFKDKRDLATSILKTLKDKRTEAITALIETNRAIERIKITQEKVYAKKGSAFRGRDGILRSINNINEETRGYLSWQIEFAQSMLAVNADLIAHQEKIVHQYDLILHELELKHKINNIWKRSPKAISLEALSQSMLEAEMFFKKMYWETPTYVKPSALWSFIKSLRLFDFFMLIVFIILYIFGFSISRYGLQASKHKSSKSLIDYQGKASFFYLQIFLTLVDFALKHFTLLFSWTFVFLHIFFNFRHIFATLYPLAHYYTITIFYLLSIPILVYLSHGLIDQIKETNKKLSYLFFAETFQDKFILLITIFCYATSILIPLRYAILSYSDVYQSEFATVILAAYSLIVALVLLFLFSKEDVLKFIPSHTTFFIWLKRKIDKHYYPVFLFCMGLLILSNPYVGYSAMAWFLAFAVPSTASLLYCIFILHYYIRRFAVFIFMKEEDDEMIDKFDHAKAYYGFFVIFSFLFISFLTFILAARIWGFDYTPTNLWKGLSEEWVIRIGVENKFGFIEFMVLSIFIAGGFLVSSLMHRFILNRLFEILRSEPGTQNTISRISHYSMILLAIVLGLNAIHLEQFIFWVVASFGIVIGLALKEVVSDFIAGFFVLIERPIEIGNFVQIDNIQGTVHRIAARSTTIITSKNHSVIIPNKDLLTKWIVNWGHGRFAIGFEIDIRVELTNDPEEVKKILLSVVQSNPYILKVPGIVSRLENIEENALYFLVRAFISARRVKEQWDLAANLRTEIYKAFKEHGISLAKPSRYLEFAKHHDGPKAIEIRFDQ